MKIALLAMLMATTLAAQTPASPPADASGDRSATHLRVEVETKYAWIYQKSVARVWATVSKDDTTRVNVGELCLQLDCYGQHKICETDTSYLEVSEIKRRIGVSKKTAYVKAWTNDAALDTVRVEMKP
ncbi:MAG: hypothetical protein IPH10_13115 [bacterium]|nr:hypothetical protein [bacterium]